MSTSSAFTGPTTAVVKIDDELITFPTTPESIDALPKDANSYIHRANFTTIVTNSQ